MKKCGILKNVGIHTLPKSYETHLLEVGADISLIQELLNIDGIQIT